MKIRHGIIAVELTDDPDEINIRHFCGYEEPPTQNDFDSLVEELNTDPEFGLIGRVGINVFVKPAPQSLVNEMAQQYDSED
jgi:hypothetical protein